MIRKLKKTLADAPVVGPYLQRIYARAKGRTFTSFKRSDQYWEDRYRVGGNSGSGSYGRLSEFKASVLNDFVRDNGIKSVVEFGSGDGAQLRLAKYPKYVGFDVSPTVIELCRKAFAHQPDYIFDLVGSERYNALAPVDLALSLDVIYHLVEDEVFDNYMRKLFAAADRYVIIYAYDAERVYSLKHERGRNFTKWIEHNAPNWELVRIVKNPYPYDPNDTNNTSQSDFFVYARR